MYMNTDTEKSLYSKPEEPIIDSKSSVETSAYFGQDHSSYVVSLHASFILLLRITASLLCAKCRISDNVIK